MYISYAYKILPSFSSISDSSSGGGFGTTSGSCVGGADGAGAVIATGGPSRTESASRDFTSGALAFDEGGGPAAISDKIRSFSFL